MFKIYQFLKVNRLKKKWKVYQRIWLLSLDITIIIYVILALGYIGTVIVLEGNLFQTIQGFLPRLKNISVSNFGYVLATLPLVYIIKAFNQSGILFTKTEWKLATLPFKKTHIWYILALERWVRTAILFSFTGIIYYIFSDSNAIVILFYIGLLWMINILMTVIEWKLFQQSVWVKLGSLVASLAILGWYLFFPSTYITVMIVLLLILLQIFGYKYFMSHIDWDKVTMAADYKVWNLPMVSYVTKVSFKKERKFNLWQQRQFWKKDFPFDKNTLYHRLWQIYFEKNLKYIFQIIGAILLMNIVFGWLKPWLFLIAVMITVHIWTSFLTVMFRDRFSVDIVEVLPWNIMKFKQSFVVWAYCQTAVLFIPFLMYVYVKWSVHYFLFLFVVIVTVILLLDEKLNKEIDLISGDVTYSKIVEAASYVALFCLLCSYLYAGFMMIAVVLTGSVGIWKLLQNGRMTRIQPR